MSYALSNSYCRPPAWFRYGVVAVAILLLCSCQVPGPTQQSAVSVKNEPVQPASHDAEPEPQSKSAVVNALYESDMGSAAERVEQATYTALACPVCQVPMDGSANCAQSGGTGPADEYLCDGGDFGLPAAVRRDWQVDGLEQEDTVAHYDTVDGRTVVTPSNRVCIYAPRFNSVRQVVELREYARYDMPVSADAQLSLAKIDEDEQTATSLNQLEPVINRVQQPPSLLAEGQQLGELANEERVEEYDGSLAPYADLQIIRAGTVSNDESAKLAEGSDAAITWSGDQAVQITIDSRRAQADVSLKQPGVVYHQDQPNHPKLRLVKLASTGSALPGEEVEFTLRLDNIGDRVMGNVTIVDNLTTRLQYVPNSAKSSVEADFTAVPNSQGSSVLRWEIKDPLEAGQGGILQFRCRVR